MLTRAPSWLLALTFVAAACSSATDGGRLLEVGDTSPQGSGRVRVPVGSVITATTTLLCAAGGQVRIRGVRLERDSGLRLVDWGWHDFPPLEYDTMHYGGLRKGFARDPIRQVCGSKPLNAAEFDLTFRTTARVAVTHGFHIDYRTGSLFVAFEIYFCSAAVCPAELQGGPLP